MRAAFSGRQANGVHLRKRTSEQTSDIQLERVRAAGFHVEPHRFSGEERQSVLGLPATGASVILLDRRFRTSRQTINRVQDAAPSDQKLS